MEGITNPPWVYGPKEVEEWIDATYRGKEEKTRRKERVERKNVEIRLSTGRRKISKKWIGIFRYCEEDIEEVLSIVLKALYKTGFKRLLYANIKIEKQGKVTLKDLENISVGIDKKKIKLVLAKGEIERVHVIAKRFHTCKRPSTIVSMEKALDEDVSRFLNIIKEKKVVIHDVLYRHLEEVAQS